VGVGVSSLTTFWLVMAGLPIGTLVLVDAGFWLLLVVAGLSSRRSRVRAAATPAGDMPHEDGPHQARPLALWLSRAGFAVVAVAAMAIVVLDYTASPHGQWDAWAIWNHKARFFIRAGQDWQSVLTIPWANPAHPLLVSTAVARLWAYAGDESTLVPAMLALAFGAGALVLVVSALGTGRSRSWIAGAVLLAPATVVHQTTAQQADVPLAFFVVAAVAALAHGGPGSRYPAPAHPVSLLLAGGLAGLAAWTKNEGLVFLAVLAVILFLVAVRGRSPRALAWWLAGAAPSVATVVWLKSVLAPVPPPYLLEAPSVGTVAARVFGSDSLVVLGAIVESVALWGGPLTAGAIPLTVAACVVAAWRRRAPLPLVSVAVAASMCAAYYAVFVSTPLEPAQLARDTLPRLLMQLWPLLVLSAFWPVAPGRSEPVPHQAV
jgi:hypothetical protein